MTVSLELRLSDPRQLREHILREAGQEAIFVPGYSDVPAGSEVAVSVRFPAEEFRIAGRVLWRRTRRGGKRAGLETGVGVAWLASQEEAVRRLYAYADAPTVSIHRRQTKRHNAAVKVRYGSMFSLANDFVKDVSLGGLRIASTHPPATVGATITLYLRPPRAFLALKLLAEIVWVNETGYGVRFTGVSTRDKRRLAALIDRLVTT